jgi:hypothetical protein
MILRGDAQLQPQKYGMRGKFANPTADAFIDISMDAPISADFICDDMSYVLRSNPVALAGTALSAFAANQFAINSGLDASVTMTGAYSLSWLLSNSFKPIEELFRWAPGPAHVIPNKEFLLIFPQEMKARILITRTLADPDTEIILTLHGRTLGFQKFGGLSLTEAKTVIESEYGISCRNHQGWGMVQGGR